MNVEDVVCSKARMRILSVLIRLGQLNVTEIARRIGTNYKNTKEHLTLLESEGILQHRMYGRTRFYRIHQTSPKVKAIQNLIETWKSTGSKVEK